ncbi:hypothetical protein Hanom_Chr03g00251651 [Helianthus anomalus]
MYGVHVHLHVIQPPVMSSMINNLFMKKMCSEFHYQINPLQKKKKEKEKNIRLPIFQCYQSTNDGHHITCPCKYI